jgi:cytochrome c biogenesis protein CcmG, thiol:disulfide interchange protein DsbE
VTLRISAFMFLLTLLVAAGCDRGDHPTQVGRPAPDFTVAEGGRTLQLSAYRGKVVVLNFWASWCAPCIEEIPSLNQLQRQMPQLVVVGVDVDEDGGAYRQFLADHRVDFLTIRDERQHSNALYGTFRFPETYVIDRRGEIRRKFISAQDWTSPEILDYLSHLQNGFAIGSIEAKAVLVLFCGGKPRLRSLWGPVIVKPLGSRRSVAQLAMMAS